MNFAKNSRLRRSLLLVTMGAGVALSFSGCGIVGLSVIPQASIPATLGTKSAFAQGYGWLRTNIGTADLAAIDVAPQPADGKILILGRATQMNLPNSMPQFHLMRLSPAGAVDSTFLSGGRAVVPLQSATQVALQTNSQILVGGSGIARFNADGTLDSQFGENGKVEGLFTSVRAISPLPNNQILVLGMNVASVTIARFNADGSSDATFGASGFTDITASNIVLGGLLPMNDNSIFFSYSNNSTVYLARLTPTGVLDSTFGSSGLFAMGFSGTANGIFQTAAANNNVIKMVVAGTSGSNFAAEQIQFNLNTRAVAVDAAYGSNGIAQSAGHLLRSADAAVAIQTVNNATRIVVGGATNPNGMTTYIISRFTETGALDTTFGSAGFATGTVSMAGNFAGTYVQGGQIFAGGTNLVGTVQRAFITAANGNGVLSTSFGSSGTVFAISAGADVAKAMARQPDGKFLIAGDSYIAGGPAAHPGIARYDANGSLDLSFGKSGVVTFATLNGSPVAENVGGIAVRADGKIYVSGLQNVSGQFKTFVARLNADGSLDGSYGTGGLAFSPGTDQMLQGNYVSKVGVLNNGKAVVTSNSMGAMLLFGFDDSGALDSSFGNAGTVSVAHPTSAAELPVDLAIAGDSTILVAATETFTKAGNQNMLIIRFTVSGNVDLTFGNQGKARLFSSASGTFTTAMALDSTGRILLAGFGVDGGNETHTRLGRLNSNGTPDLRFGQSGILYTNFSDPSDHASAIAVQPGGKIVVAGKIYAAGQSSVGFSTARFNDDGSLDTTFGSASNGVANMFLAGSQVTTDQAGPTAMLVQADGKIVLAGFTGSSGPDFDFVAARLTGDGFADTN